MQFTDSRSDPNEVRIAEPKELHKLAAEFGVLRTRGDCLLSTVYGIPPAALSLWWLAFEVSSCYANDANFTAEHANLRIF
jgi:hypothetical protein